MMKRLLCLIAACALLLLTASALAVAQPTAMEILEETAIPMAKQNDTEIGVVEEYSADELAELMRMLNERGIILDETSKVTQAVRNGRGYWEEETIMEIGRHAFGGYISSWTLEQQDWFHRMMVEIGFTDTYVSRLPGPENWSEEEATAAALEAIRQRCGEDLPVTDRTVFALDRHFDLGDESDPASTFWSFTLVPLDLDHGQYTVSFMDHRRPNPAGVTAEVPDWSKPYTGEQLIYRFQRTCLWGPGTLDQKAWHRLHELMTSAEIQPNDRYYTEALAYQLTEYPLIAANDLTREQAVEIARTAQGGDRAALNYAVLTEYGDQRAWLITLLVPSPEDPSLLDTFVVTVASPDGHVESVRQRTADDSTLMFFVPQAVYEKVRENTLTRSDIIRLAAETIEARYPALKLLDEETYTVYTDGIRRWSIRFVPKDIHLGEVTATVENDGTITAYEVDDAPLSGDNLFDRYWSVYGYYGGWDQATWAQLSRDMEDLSPEGIEGKLIRQTDYPAEDSVAITREQAMALAVQATGKRSAEAHTCVLIGAEPHPVWKLRVLDYEDEADPMIELDAETGEVLNIDRYMVDVTPRYHVFTLERDWRATEAAETGTNADASDPEAEIVPTPRPDGLPILWRGEFAAPEFWTKAEQVMSELGMTPANAQQMIAEWERAYGDGQWPQDQYVLYFLYSVRFVWEVSDYYPIFIPDGKPGTDEIRQIARQAFHQAADPVHGAAWVDGLDCVAYLNSDAYNYNAVWPENDKYGYPVWYVEFYTIDNGNWNHHGYAMLDEDGRVLDAQDEESNG